MTYKTQLKKRVLAGLLAGTALWLGMPAALAASGVVPNTQLPQGGHFINGGINDVIGNAVNGQMTITQESQNAVIQWDKGFNVGANATVNFEKGKITAGPEILIRSIMMPAEICPRSTGQSTRRKAISTS